MLCAAHTSLSSFHDTDIIPPRVLYALSLQERSSLPKHSLPRGKSEHALTNMRIVEEAAHLLSSLFPIHEVNGVAYRVEDAQVDQDEHDLINDIPSYIKESSLKALSSWMTGSLALPVSRLKILVVMLSTGGTVHKRKIAAKP